MLIANGGRGAELLGCEVCEAEACEAEAARVNLPRPHEPIERFHIQLHLSANDDCSTSLGAPEHSPTARLGHRPLNYLDQQSTVRTMLVQCTASLILPRRARLANHVARIGKKNILHAVAARP